MKTKLMLAFLAVTACGCQTLNTLGQINRVVPQLQKLVTDKDLTSPGVTTGSVLCGKTPDELRFLTAAAKQMGWEAVTTTAEVASGCQAVIYQRPQ